MAEKKNGGEGVAGDLIETVDKSGAEVIADLAQRFKPTQHTVKPIEPGQVEAPYALVPDGMRVASLRDVLEAYREHPKHRTGTAELDDVGSLVAYVKMFAGGDSRIYARAPTYDPDAEPRYAAGAITAVIDHHRAGFDAQPDWCQHRARLSLPLARELTRWLDAADRYMPQAAFAEFVEDRIDDVMPAMTQEDRDAYKGLSQLVAMLGVTVAGREELRKVSRGLKVSVGRKVESRFDPTTGETTMTFAEEHAGDGAERLKVPDAFVVHLPVFDRGDWYPLLVRLRHRPASQIYWAFSFHNLGQVIADVFADVRKSVATGTALPVWLGAPA